MYLRLVVFLFEDGDGVEGGLVIIRLIVSRLLSHLSVFVGFFLVLMLEPEVDGVDELFLIERLHDQLGLSCQQRFIPILDGMLIPFILKLLRNGSPLLSIFLNILNQDIIFLFKPVLLHL